MELETNRRNGKTRELAMTLYNELKKLPDCKLFGIKNYKGKAILLTNEECIPKEKVEKKIEELRHKDFIKLQVCYKHDNEALKQVKILQELLEE